MWRATPASLHSAIGNLVDNAINYSADGGQVDVSVYGLAGHACIEVLDNGIGIPEASLPRVFDRFFRASESEVEGSGLGLAIVKAIAERCGGTASVANRDDGRSGVLARICFPLY
jgi:two-component system OmpR family sensor kinase